MKKRKKNILRMGILLLFAAIIGIYSVRNRTDNTFIRAQDFKLNTLITVTIYDSEDTTLLQECMELCDYYEGLFSRTLPASEIYRLNHGELSTVSPETAELIHMGLEYCELSGGSFDISIAPVSSLWDFSSEEKKIPSEEELQKALELVDYRKVHLNGQTVTFETEGMGLDLGAIAKGYIADRLKEHLIEAGVTSATINLGGNVLCIGEKKDGSAFRIGVQKPFAERNETIAICDIRNQSLVSSGTYERYFELDNRIYHHLLNPFTGYPYDNGLTGVTILSDISAVGDALSTTCFSLGLEKGMELLNSIDGAEGFFVTEDQEIHYSEHFPSAN